MCMYLTAKVPNTLGKNHLEYSVTITDKIKYIGTHDPVISLLDIYLEK